MRKVENFYKNLKIMLKEKGISYTQFAEMIGVSNSCVSKWIHGQREPTLSNINKVLEILDSTFEEMME